MPIIDTSTLRQNDINSDTEFVYNGLDCALTLEIFEEISSLYNAPPDIYSFSRALQAPVLEMMCRGFRVDEYERQAAIRDIRQLIGTLERQLQVLAFAVWDKELNPRSPKQLLEFFYGRMRLPEIWTSQKGVRKLSMNMETLEKLEVYLHARPIIAHILRIRELSKMLSVLETEIDPDHRMRTSYNIGGTESGRFSSSANAFGTGTNLQNLRQDPDWRLDDGKYKISLRKIFIADPGMKICGIDLEQAESREVGWQLGVLFDDWTYLDACEAGDLHTKTCQLIWDNLGWTGDPKADRKLADQNFYRQFSYRDMSKRGGHGCLTIGHEVLTRDGWVDISKKPAEIMMWSPHFKSYFGSVSHWEDKTYTGNFVTLKGTSIDLELTEDHRVVYYKDRRFDHHVSPAGNLPSSGVIPLGNHYIGGNENISVAMARIVAAYQCDGHQKSTNRVEFHFHKARKFERLAIIANAADIPYERRENKAFLECNIPYEKKAGAYLLNWPREALEAYIDEHQYWDGHITGTSVALFSVSHDHLEWLQTIGRLLGIGGNFQKANISGFGSVVHKLQQNNRSFADIGSLKENTKEHKTARVLCPTVETGFFYVRRNGKISVTGNSNYLGTPFTMARHLKVPTKLMETFQTAYFRAYPIPRWHTWTAGQIQTIQQLTTPFGRRRHFFGRPNDDTTLREAVAYVPQSATADRMNLALWRIWYYMPQVQLLAQVHDAVYFQFPENLDPSNIISEAISNLRTVIKHQRPNGQIREFDVPGEAKVGWNWGNYHEKHNPDGLQKWKGQDDRKRSGSGLQRVM